jgi:hypothetical protein
MSTLRNFQRFLSLTVVAGFACLAPAQTANAADENIPHLRKQGTATQLIVDGKPFLVLGGELGNSTSSSPDNMLPIWPRLARMNLNTVLAAVSWELIEPKEGQYDFWCVDGLIRDARANNLRLVFLWFGSWKNGLSSYPPMWVKTNPQRFPWVKNAQGATVDILSTFGENTAAADAKAFGALLKHLKEVDEKHTVLFIQVENEVGVRGDSRDRCPAANTAFAAPVPRELMDYINSHRENLLPQLRQRLTAAGNKAAGTWTEVFGSGMATDETFMAWQYARYLNKVAAAGKAEYPIPLYANCWLEQGGNPGNWPSGGPVSYLLDIWQAGAPAVDFLAPDIYAGNFAERCMLYNRNGNPLFIPEATTGNGYNALYVFGKHDAIGFSPFGIERGAGGRGGAAPAAGPDTSPLAQSYLALAGLAPAILENQGKGTTFSWMLGAGSLDANAQQQQGKVGDFTFTAKRGANAAAGGGGRGGAGGGTATGLIIPVAADEFYILHSGSDITFAPTAGGTAVISFIEEGSYVDGKWTAKPRINGNDPAAGTLLATAFRNLHLKLTAKP